MSAALEPAPPRVQLRRPGLHDTDAFLRAVAQSRSLHRPWVQAPATVAAFRQYLERMDDPAHEPFLISLRGDGALVGVVNLTNVVMGSFCSGYLGYYAFSGFERRGLMAEAVRLVIEHAFGSLGLHRLEANIQPDNGASIALARRCGFQREGFSPKYLRIDGGWRDHERWAIVAQ